MTERQITHTMPDVKSIACLGDSITAGYFDEEGYGWPARLSNLFATRKPMQYHVQSCGISGDTIISAWHNLLSQVTHINPDILLIKIGINDVCVREGIEPESCQISRADRLNFWLKIVRFIKLNYKNVIVISPLPISKDVIRFKAWEDDAKGQTSFRYEQNVIKTYVEDINTICKENGLPFVDLFAEWIKSPDLDKLYIDGLHPNTKGQAKLANDIFENMKEMGF